MCLAGLFPALLALAIPSSTSAEASMSAAVRSATPDAAGGREVRFEGVAGAELLPGTDSYLVESRIEFRGRTLRYPLVVGPAEATDWSVRWRPERTYRRALFGAIAGGDLAALVPAGPSDRARAWADRARLPALPVLLSEGRAVLPTGAANIVGSGRLEPRRSLREAISGWTRRVGRQHPGLAALDVIVGRGATWHDLMTLLYAVSGAGIFRLHAVGTGQEGGDLTAVSFAAPVFDADPDESIVVALGEQTRSGPWPVRVSLSGERLEQHQPCTPAATFCTESLNELAAKVRRALSERERSIPSVEHVVLAASADVRVADGLRAASGVAEALDVPTAKVVLSYVGPEMAGASVGGER